MNTLLLSYIMNACCVKLRYHKMHIYIHTYIHIYMCVCVCIYIMIYNNALNFKAQLITYI